jgi:hypothetical protein
MVRCVEPLQLVTLVCQIDCFGDHGWWKSETAKDGYIKESFSDRILV